ncbi:DUF2269 family protein [Paenibacillus tuaregi]|uniref:DUF2269 family protein n=1 Tax=Paenibacillus tuaregi TaxID=1816681 RepID=UPI000838CA5B|nr:DUF2269 family protein [Paenibacillus tuaregi]
MEALEKLLVLIHVLAAIIGIGPAFVLPMISGFARTSSQLKFVYKMNIALGKFPKIGGITLLVTGVLLMIVDQTGFSKMWLNLSLVLFVLIEILILAFLEPTMKKAGQIIAQHNGEDIPAAYEPFAHKLNYLNKTVHVLTVLVIILMVIRP